MPERRKLILALLERCEAPLSLQRLHGRLFTLCSKVRKAPFAFLPSEQGYWSFRLDEDLKKLADKGLIRKGETVELLRAPEERLQDPQLQYVLEETLQATTEAKEEELLERSRRTFQNFPPPPFYPTLFTIGYEGRSLEAYVEELLDQGVRVLCDLRKDPVSRKFGFSKKQLEQACAHFGIAYQHLPELGIPKEERQKVRSEADRTALLDRYEEQFLPQAQAGLRRLEGLLAERKGIALTCYEADPAQCHRYRVVKALEDGGIEARVTHL